MDTILQVTSFGAKALVVALALVLVIWFIAKLVGRAAPETGLRVRALDERLRALSDTLSRATLSRHELKRARRVARERRAERKQARPHIYVLDFVGDLPASASHALRHEVTAVLGVVRPEDEVVLRLESPGGFAHQYGFAASQLKRLRERKVRLTATIDKIAASGGYMMAAVADEIVAAPFAIVGSIGVISAVPNIHRLLTEHGVDYEEMTAGEFKRTVSLLAEISEAGRAKFQAQLEETHALFKQFVAEARPSVDIGAVATGEYWFATRARELKLVDRIMTSDDYLLGRMASANIFQVTYKERLPLGRRLTALAREEIDVLALRWWDRLAAPRPPMMR